MSQETNPVTNPTPENPEGGKDVTPEAGTSQEEINAMIDKILAESNEEPAAQPAVNNEPQKTEEPKEPKADDILNYVKNISGRDFKDQADFEKHYKNLTSFVGDGKIQSYKTKAELYDKLMAEADNVAKALNPEPQPQPEAPKPDESVKEIKDEVARLREELQVKDFVAANPDAVPVLDIIKAVSAQTGKSVNEVYSSSEIKNLIEERKQLKELQAQTKDLGVNSNQRITPPKSEVIGGIVKQLTDPKYIPGRDTDKLKQKLVEEYFDLK